MVKYFIAGLFCLLSLFISAQDQFLVYSIKGDVSFTTNNTKSIAKTGTILTASSIVNVPDEGAVTFICKSGGMFSITSKGSYSLTGFSDSCNNKNSALFTNYSKFVWDRLTKPANDQGKNRSHYFPNYEVRIRDQHGDIWINQIFDTVNYSHNGDFPLSWRSYSDKRKFSFSLYRPGKTMAPFYSITVTESKILFTDFLYTIKQGNSCYWGVSIPGEESDELNVFNYVSKETYDSVLLTIRKLKPVFEAKAEETFRTAFMLENAHYFAEAMEYYATATILDPTNVFYWSTMRSFLKEYDIK